MKTSDQRSIAIVDALHDAKSGQEVYNALCAVPTDNLNDIRDMISNILQFREEEKMRKSPEYLPDEIHITWSIDDIKSRVFCNELSNNDCREILDQLKRNHDANVGISWEIIDIYIHNFLEGKDNE